MPAVERRKIQRTGSSSFIITLPKEWVDLMKLKSGDYVLIEKYNDKLLIMPSTAEGLQLRSTVKVTGVTDVSQIFRMVLSAYLSGYSIITLQFDPKLPDLAKIISDVKNLCRIKLAGLEVIEETYNTVSFKILLNLRELPLITAIKRLHLIVNNMLNDALQLVRSGDRNIAMAILQRDDEADRFHHMIVRELSLALLDIRVQHELGLVSSVEALSYRIIARNLERIADHVVNIAKRFTSVSPSPAVDIVEGLLSQAIEVFNKAMNSLYTLSRRDAEDVIESARAVVQEVDRTITDKLIKMRISESEKASLVLICDSIRRIARYSNGIAESILNIRAAKSQEIELK